ncbi:MAG: hypothetical protein ACE5EL_05775 [Anaerolineae bacterium]
MTTSLKKIGLALTLTAVAVIAAYSLAPSLFKGPEPVVPPVTMGTEAIVNVTYENRCDAENQAPATGVRFTLDGFGGNASLYQLETVQPNLWTSPDVQTATINDTIATSGASQWTIEWNQPTGSSDVVPYGQSHHFGYALNNGTSQTYPDHHVTLQWMFGPNFTPLEDCINDAWSYEWTPPVGSTPTTVVGARGGATTPSAAVVPDGRGWKTTAASAQHSRDAVVADLAYYVSQKRLTVHDLMEESRVFKNRTIVRSGARMPAGSVATIDVPIAAGARSVVVIAEFRTAEGGEASPYMIAFAGAPLDWDTGQEPVVPTD